MQRWPTRLILAFPPGALVFISWRQLILHKPWGSPPLSNGGLIFLTVLLLAVYLRLITVKLVTELRPNEIEVGLRGLWKRRRIRLDQVRSTTVVNFDPIRDFGGYGMRTTKRGTGYIGRSHRGVELVLVSGAKVIIGSNRPEELARAIREAIS